MADGALSHLARCGPSIVPGGSRSSLDAGGHLADRVHRSDAEQAAPADHLAQIEAWRETTGKARFAMLMPALQWLPPEAAHGLALWALRTRNRLMHDGLSFTKQEAIARHAGQASGVKAAYDALSTAQKNQVLAFLDSL